jgi:transposase-like protein
VSAEKKLDKRKDEISELLLKNVHKTSIARIVGCSPATLYAWMENNGLSRFIKSDKPLKAKVRLCSYWSIVGCFYPTYQK